MSYPRARIDRSSADPPTAPTRWTLEGFAEEFGRIHRQMSDRAFAFVLGSGASKNSGIKTGAELVDIWLGEMYKFDPEARELPISQWATAETLGIKDFSWEMRPAFYSEVYERRFGDDPEKGYAFLENLMADAEPSFGYSVLAQILKNEAHNVAVTTNFDNLLADALSIYTGISPLVLGHESLTEFVRIPPRRPLIAKVHRDLLLAPLNVPQELRQLEEGWTRALTRIFSRYTPIVIGYGGNDGSLMSFLESLEPRSMKGGIYWCHCGRQTDQRIQRVVARQDGKLIRISGFDQIMMVLNDELGYDLIDGRILQKATERVAEYRRQVDELRATAKRDARDQGLVQSALKAAAERGESDMSWWRWQVLVNLTSSSQEKERLYRQGLREFPDSAELAGNLAALLHSLHKSYDEAERLYRRALELDENNAAYAGNLASFLHEIKGRYDEAERLYRNALELDPADAGIVVNFANFLRDVRKDHDAAEIYFEQAIALAPQDATILSNLGEFLLLRGELPRAEAMNLAAAKLLSDETSTTAAGIAFNLGLIARLNKLDDSRQLGFLKNYIEGGGNGGGWVFERVLDLAHETLSPEDAGFYERVAAAVCDPSNKTGLEQYSRWQAIKPAPLAALWSRELYVPAGRDKRTHAPATSSRE